MTGPAPRRVLVGVDGSERAQRALAFALGLARREPARLVVAHVEEPPLPYLRTTTDVDLWIADQRAVTRGLRALVQASCREGAVDCDVLTLYGHPYPQLAEAARACRVDAIVVGTTGRSGHLLVGSVAGRLIRAGICPVTVVP